MLLLLKPTANAIFLSNLGVENLPIAYIALAFLALAVSIVYNEYVNIGSTYKLFIKSNIIFNGTRASRERDFYFNTIVASNICAKCCLVFSRN